LADLRALPLRLVPRALEAVRLAAFTARFLAFLGFFRAFGRAAAAFLAGLAAALGLGEVGARTTGAAEAGGAGGGLTVGAAEAGPLARPGIVGCG